ncbi:hypothetical protein [Rhodococcus kronopolitis]|uniref:DNA phosphorothioation-associated protein 4 n=1 Tax=Rhodococcus kronopolitis TaxID=1460226 RepID=A0ABV9FZS4_9NOCA
MTSVSNEVRARRPHEYATLMGELQAEAGFPTFRDILLFAAAVGFRQGRRVPFVKTSGESIRLDVLMAPAFSDTLVNMIAANVVSDDPEIMDGGRVGSRIKIFEEYANGGLEYIQEQKNVGHESLNTIVRRLVTEAFAGEKGAKQLDNLLSSPGW